ncbi:MAG: MerR family DNA-binding transcriptional regulator [Gammaproteobacteria bacterium]|nr:MerR family DNA-binding transcriptional regulator [Gammaproteobacteria bacterium]
MRIGELATACDCPVETIRYYEKIGLLPAAARLANGYRSYDDEHRKWLQFIIRSRELGFSQDEVRRLTDLAHQERAACSDVFELLEHHMADVRDRIVELQRLENALVRLTNQCHEGTLHDCPVIDELMR